MRLRGFGSTGGLLTFSMTSAGRRAAAANAMNATAASRQTQVPCLPGSLPPNRVPSTNAACGDDGSRSRLGKDGHRRAQTQTRRPPGSRCMPGSKDRKAVAALWPCRVAGRAGVTASKKNRVSAGPSRGLRQLGVCGCLAVGHLRGPGLSGSRADGGSEEHGCRSCSPYPARLVAAAEPLSDEIMSEASSAADVRTSGRVLSVPSPSPSPSLSSFRAE